jgi:hypothetical protein
MRYLAILVFTAAVWGQQQWEVGATIGYGVYRDGTIFSDTQTVQAGIRNRFAAGINIGQDYNDYLSGEFQYLYHDGHPFLQAPGVKSDIQGQSDALTLNVLLFFKSRAHRVRPFVEGGAGGIDHIVAGPAPFPQPIPQVASLTTNDVWKVVVVPGAGVKFQVIPHMLFRAEFRDYLTTFARQQIVPAPHNTARGIFQQFTPLFGVSYTWGSTPSPKHK